MPDHPPLVVFGGGSMGSTIVRAGIEREILDPSRVTVCEPDEYRWEFFRDRGVSATKDDVHRAIESIVESFRIPSAFAPLRNTVIWRSFLEGLGAAR